LKRKILIFGAGAIGRGFIAPLFYKNNYEISFVDSNGELVDKLNKKKKYFAGVIKNNKYEFNKIFVKKTYKLNDKMDIKDFDIVVSCVGINNCYKNFEHYKNAKYLISCENDINTVSRLKKLSRNNNFFFGIPDVITSNTAPKKILVKDDLTVISEDGTLVLEKFTKNLPNEIEFVSKDYLEKHWICKLYIHNAPHAIAAYLGYLKNYKFVHESMKNQKIKKIVVGSIKEITDGLINCKIIDKKFAHYYMHKELKRFSNKLLFDPISRVARDPIRKLSKNDRLIKAIQISLYNTKLPSNCAIGILAALKYYDKKDSQSQHLKLMIENFGKEYAMEKVCGLEKDDPLIKFCLSQKINI
jgi:mannitol-1-phosphate 5-dehydrogenase